MALHKSVRLLVLLLLLGFTLKNSEYGQSVTEYFQELLDLKSSTIVTRRKRETPVHVDIIVDLSFPSSMFSPNEIDSIQRLLGGLSLPQNITAFTNVTDVSVTTGCFPSDGDLQCHCVDTFVWSCTKCNVYGGCFENVINQTCNCINGLPSDGTFCQPITSIDDCPPSPVPLFYEIVADFRFPGSLISMDLLEIIKSQLKNISNQPINSFLSITYINISTTCLPKTEADVQCQCEEEFLWPCDICNMYETCSNVTHQSCDCIRGLPSDGSFCQTSTSVSECPTTTTVRLFYEIVADVRFPGSLVSIDLLEIIKTQLSDVRSAPINSFLNVSYIKVSTTCLPLSDAGVECQCEEEFLWSCDHCNMYEKCNVTQQSCNCIRGLPSDGSFCQISTSVSACPTTPTTTAVVTKTTIRSTKPSRVLNLTSDFVFNLDFTPIHNNQDSVLRQDFSTSIQIQSKKHITDLVGVEFGTFRRGSTIANFTISATSEISPSELENLHIGLFNDLSSKYPVIFDGNGRVRSEPEEVFTGFPLTLICDPPPEELNFGSDWTVVWLLNGDVITHHTPFNQNGLDQLRLENVYNTDNGLYECQLRTPSASRLRRRASEPFTIKERPVVSVNRIKQLISCEVEVEVECSVNEPYEVFFPDFPESDTGNEISYVVEPSTCESMIIRCQVKDFEVFEKNIELVQSEEEIICVDDEFGNGTLNFRASVDCEEDFVGNRTAVCRASTKFEDFEENCILRVIKTLLDQSEFLTAITLPEFLEELSNATVSFSTQIVNSTATINAIVEIFENVAEVALNTTIRREMMEDVLISAGILTIDEAREAWQFLNKVTLNISETDISDPIRHLESASQSLLLASQSRSSEISATSVSGSFLQSLETITSRVVNTTVNISTPSILLNKTTFRDSFSSGFNSSVEIDLPESDGENLTLTVVTFLSMDNVLPPRDEVNSSSNVINGRVVIVQSFSDVNNISLTFEVLNTSLNKPQCVFWNFSLFDGLGGWSGEGCELVFNVNDTVTCNCNHLTSFSMLMSFGNFTHPVLDFITYIGVSISLAALLLCLIIEAVVWRKLTRDELLHVHHICIVNIAVSLLIADIWFLVGAAISGRGDTPACTAAAFFIHLFYLAMFFWMLCGALLLIYHIANRNGKNLTKNAQIGIGFAMGYGIPIIITVITIAVTAPDNEYIQRSGLCWLNIKDSLALLAFVVPALLIVLFNLIVLIVVIFKICKFRGIVGGNVSQSQLKLRRIIKTLATLTPLFGITWGLGVGIIVDPFNLGVHITFAIFNSLQGLFVLIFGTLIDAKVRTAMTDMSSTIASRISGTHSTSNGNSSSGARGNRRGNNTSSGTNVESQSLNT